jgi:tape measure domain-containing protein
MAIQVETLVATLEARIDKYEKSLAKAVGSTDRQFKTIENRGKKMESTMAKLGQSIGGAFSRNLTGPIVAAFTAAISASAVKSLIDSAVKIENQLKSTGLEGKDLQTVYDALFASAQRNATPIEALATLYSRASAAADDLKASQQDLLKFTDNIALAMRVSGQSAEESAGALLQLSQALGNGKVQAEEYNSLLDSGRPILQAVAAGLKDAGGSIGKLTQLVKAGKVSSQAFFRAFQAGAPSLEDAVAHAEATVSQSLVRIQNALTDAAGRFNESTKASELFGRAAAEIASEINSINFDKLVEQIEYVISALNRGVSAFGDFLDAAGKAGGLQSFAQKLVGMLPGDTTVKDPFAGTPLEGSFVITPQDTVQQRIQDSHNLPVNDRTSLTPEQIRAFAMPNSTEAAAKTSRLPADNQVKPVSLSDFPVPPSSSSSGSKSKTDDYQREVDGLKERTAALQATYAAQKSLNPLQADYAEKVTAVEKATELLTAAQKSGKDVGKELSDVNQLLYGDLSKLSPAARQQALDMRNAALSYADASDKLSKLKDAQDAAAQAAKDMIELQKDVISGAMSDIRSAFEDGKITAQEWGEVVVNMLNKVADKLQEMLVDQLFKSGGLLGGLLGSVTGGSVGGSPAAGTVAKAAPISSASLTRAPPAMDAAALKRQSIDLDITTRSYMDEDGKWQQRVEKIASNVSARTGKAGLDQYRRGQLRQDIQKHLGSPRVKGVI